MRKRSQVIIVGGGPVGVGLAVDLGLRGISCTLVERRIGMHKIPRGQNLAQRTLERFYFWGCVDELRAQRMLPPEVPVSGVTAYKSLTSEYWHAFAGREAVGWACRGRLTPPRPGRVRSSPGRSAVGLLTAARAGRSERGDRQRGRRPGFCPARSGRRDQAAPGAGGGDRPDPPRDLCLTY